MNRPMLRLALLSVVLAALPPGIAAAEENRLLPFWGQPYPSGYAWNDAVIDRDAIPPCRPERRAIRAGRHDASEFRCRVVLHARD